MLKRKAGDSSDNCHDLPVKKMQTVTPDGANNEGTKLPINGSSHLTAGQNQPVSKPTTDQSAASSNDLETSAASLAAPSVTSATPGVVKVEDVDEDSESDSENEVDGSCSTNPPAALDGDDNEIDGFSSEDELGPMAWIQKQMQEGKNPRTLLSELLPDGTVIPEGVHDVMLWKIIVSLLSDPPKRKKLDSVNTLDDLVQLIRKCNKIVVLTGAGVSVSCGIPDFRSRDGLYARLAEEYPDLPDPTAMFDIQYFKGNPYPFFKFAKEIFPGSFQPSPSHRFIKAIESKNKLLRNYTQNIDTLEQVAAIENVVQCHGSFANATCMKCKHKVQCAEIKEEIMNQKIPHCKLCEPDEENPLNIIKPDIVFFGESLPDEFHNQVAEDKSVCDLLIVIGSSLKVRPVSLIPDSLPASIPQVLINREPLPHMTFDMELLGDCDVIAQELTRRLQWDRLTATPQPPLSEITSEQLTPVAPAPRPPLSAKFMLRPPDAIVESSLCFSDMETSQISNYNHPMSVDGSPNPSRQGHDGINHPPTSTTASSIHSFSGKLQEAISPSKSAAASAHNQIPTTSSAAAAPPVPETADAESHSISSRLPAGTFLYIEPSRYVFSGAEVYSDGDSDSEHDEDDDGMTSDIHSEPYDPSQLTSDTDQHDSDNNEGPSDHHQAMSEFARQIETVRAQVIHHDEDAFDAFPEPNNSSNSRSFGIDIDSPSEHSSQMPFQSKYSNFRN